MLKNTKTLKNLLYAGAFVGAASLFSGCKPDPVIEPPKDTASPQFSISSPLEQKVYDTPTVNIAGTIVEDNLKIAWYSIDNEKTKVPIGKSFSENLTLENGNYAAVFYAEDYNNPSTKKNISFSVNKIPVVNSFVQPNESNLNWYGSGDVNNDNTVNSQDLTRLNEIIAGTYSNPSDKRLKDRADVNGDEVVNSQDRQLLEDKLNGIISHLPAYWNELNYEKRKDWFLKMLKIDKTNEIPPTTEFDCDQHLYQVMINFGAFKTEDLKKFLEITPSYDTLNTCRFNIPIEGVDIGFYNSEDKRLGGHSIGTVILGNNALNMEDRCNFGTETDAIDVDIGKDYIPSDHQKIWIRGLPVNAGQNPDGTKYVVLTSHLTYSLKNNLFTLIETNPKINLILQRGK